MSPEETVISHVLQDQLLEAARKLGATAPLKTGDRVRLKDPTRFQSAQSGTVTRRSNRSAQYVLVRFDSSTREQMIAEARLMRIAEAGNAEG